MDATRQDSEPHQAPQPNPVAARCPICDAPRVEYFFGRHGDLDERVCINGHHDDGPPKPLVSEHVAVREAPTTPEALARFDRVVGARYRELRKIARNALDGGKIPSAGDCVQEAVAGLLRTGKYDTCATDEEQFGQLARRVALQARAAIKEWARRRARYRSLATEQALRRGASDGGDELVGKGADRELSSDNKTVDEAIDSELRPRPVERTRDLRIEAAQALRDERVTLDVQLVLTEHVTRKDLLQSMPPRSRYLYGALLTNDIDDAIQRLAKRLDDYCPVPGVIRDWRGGRWVPDYQAHRRYIRRWIDSWRPVPASHQMVTSFSLWPEIDL